MSHEYDDGTAAADAAYRAAVGMLGNAALPMKEPEELVSLEQKLLATELRLMSEQVENERLAKAVKAAHKAAVKAKAAMRKRIVYQSGRPSNNQRISMSVRLDDAKELLAWMELVSRYNLKLPPKGVIKFRQSLAKRLAKP